MRHLKIAVIISILVINIGITNASFKKDVGTSGAQFLKIAVGARPVALGEAFSAVPGDIYSAYYNPAGLGFIDKTIITAQHNEYLEEINYEYLGFGMPIFNNGSRLGLSLVMLNTGKIQKTLSDANPAGYFTASDYSINMTYAKKWQKLGFGITGKFINQKNESENAMGFAVDIGVLAKLTKNLSAGISALNIGPKITFISEGDKLPSSVRAGLSYNYRFNNAFGFLLSIDGVQPIDNEIYFGTGAELQIFKFLFLRAGYKSNSDLDNGLSGGIGINLLNLDIDYAYVPQGDLDKTQRISLSMKF